VYSWRLRRSSGKVGRSPSAETGAADFSSARLNGDHRLLAARNVFGEPLEICSIEPMTEFLSGWLLQYGTRGYWWSNGLVFDFACLWWDSRLWQTHMTHVTNAIGLAVEG
jgi:hypothetical protein